MFFYYLCTIPQDRRCNKLMSYQVKHGGENTVIGVSVTIRPIRQRHIVYITHFCGLHLNFFLMKIIHFAIFIFGPSWISPEILDLRFY